MPADLGVVFPAANRRGGVELVVWEVLRHFAPRVDTVYIGAELTPPLPGVTHRRVPREGRTGAFRSAAGAALRHDRPATVLSNGVDCPAGDVFWVHSVHRSWIAAAPGITWHGLAVPGRARRLLPRHRTLLDLEREYFTHHRPRAVLCTSLREVEDLQTWYRVDPDVLHVVPNGYDPSRFNAPAAGVRAVMRSRLGISPDEVSLLFVANELHRKGLAVLLDAVARVGDERRLRIDLVGRTPPAPFRGQIERLGLADRVHWHGATAEVEHYMAAGDLLVLPTQYEPFGLVIVEALASGLPVITTTLAGAAPAVLPGTGLLQQDPHDADELAELLRQALLPGVLDAWTQAAPRAAEPYEWGKVLARAEPLIFSGA